MGTKKVISGIKVGDEDVKVIVGAGFKSDHIDGFNIEMNPRTIVDLLKAHKEITRKKKDKDGNEYPTVSLSLFKPKGKDYYLLKVNEYFFDDSKKVYKDIETSGAPKETSSSTIEDDDLPF